MNPKLIENFGAISLDSLRLKKTENDYMRCDWPQETTVDDARNFMKVYVRQERHSNNYGN